MDDIFNLDLRPDVDDLMTGPLWEQFNENLNMLNEALDQELYLEDFVDNNDKPSIIPGINNAALHGRMQQLRKNNKCERLSDTRK